MTFEEIGLDSQLLESLSYMGFEKASPIQEQAIPEILKGRDVLACAQTGTGKTAAFMLPILSRLANKNNDFVSTLIIVPTRELALQIDQQIQGFSYFVNVTSIAIYGGGASGKEWENQKMALTQGADIIVATPGKLISHLNMGYVKFDKLQYLILDEADRMLDMGFVDDINKIISHLPKENRQSLFFSATMPSKISVLSKQILKDPFEVKIAISKPAAGVLQAAYLTYNPQKTKLITSLIRGKNDYKSILIFSSTKKNVTEIVRGLRKEGHKAEGISSDLEQTEREEVLLRFRTKQNRILVATDVLSRGIDIKDINLVINYDVPNDAEDYVHRIGRTARADATGVAITFINEYDMEKFHSIETLIEREVHKSALPKGFEDGPKWNPNAPKKRKFNNNFKGKKKRFPSRKK